MPEHPTPGTRPTSSCLLCSLASGEYARLAAYAEEFGRLMALYDRAPARWKYFQTEWLWLFARGMAEGRSAANVRWTRLAHLDQQRGQEAIKAEEEAIELRRASFTVLGPLKEKESC